MDVASSRRAVSDRHQEFAVSKFCLPDGYRENEFDPYTDTVENSENCQRASYEFALSLATKGCRYLDIGCGIGLKTRSFRKYTRKIHGVDFLDDHIKSCREFDFGRWMTYDLDSNASFPFRGPFDLITCIDVIEHVRDPDRLISLLLDLKGDHGKVVLTTPDRKAVRPQAHIGPPPNPHHVREWESSEFVCYLQSRGVIVANSFHVKGHAESDLESTFLVVI